jgi:hypothetical protein
VSRSDDEARLSQRNEPSGRDGRRCGLIRSTIEKDWERALAERGPTLLIKGDATAADQVGWQPDSFDQTGRQAESLSYVVPWDGPRYREPLKSNGR